MVPWRSGIVGNEVHVGVVPGLVQGGLEQGGFRATQVFPDHAEDAVVLIVMRPTPVGADEIAQVKHAFLSLAGRADAAEFGFDRKVFVLVVAKPPVELQYLAGAYIICIEGDFDRWGPAGSDSETQDFMIQV